MPITSFEYPTLLKSFIAKEMYDLPSLLAIFFFDESSVTSLYERLAKLVRAGSYFLYNSVYTDW